MADTTEAKKLLRALIEEACPVNWGDEPSSAVLWLKAEALTGTPLPEPDYSMNVKARQIFDASAA